MTVAEVEVLVTADPSSALAGLKQVETATKTSAKNMGEAVGTVDKTLGGLKGTFASIGTSGRSAFDELASRFGIARRSVEGDAKAMGGAVEKAFKQAGDSADDADRRTKGYASTLGKVGSLAHSAGIGLTTGLTAPLLLAAKAGATYAGDFEQSLSVFRVTTGATADEMKRMGAEAVALGNDAKLPGTSALDAAHAMLELSKAGLSVKDSMGAARSVLEMSVVAQISNAEAAEITAHALNAFEIAGKDAGKVADMLAASATASGAHLGEMADGMSQAASTFHAAHIPIEDLVTSMSELAKAGMKGSDAGTSLKMMVMLLQKPTHEAAVELKNLGVNVFDAAGKMLPYRTIIKELQIATADLTEKQKAQALTTIFGTDAARAANVVVGQGIQRFDALEKVVTKQGTAAKQAAAANEGFRGALDAATSSGQTMLQNFFTPVLPKLTDFFKGVGDAANAVDGWSDTSKTAATYALLFAGALGPVALGVKAVTTLTEGYVTVSGLFRAAKTAETAATVATTVATGAATVAVAAETAAVETNNIAARLAAIAIGEEAAANDALAGSAVAVEGAMAGEAGAIDGVAASARVATGSLLSMRSAALGAMAAYAGWQAGSAVHNWMDGESQKQGYDDSGDRAYKRMGFDGTLGGAWKVAWDHDDSADRRARSDAAPNAYAVAQGRKGAAGRRASTVALGIAGIVGGIGAAEDGPSADDVAASEAAAVRYTAMEGAGKAKKGRKGGGGRSAGDKEAAKEAREEASAIATLKGQYYEAAKAVALYGDDKESAALLYDVAHGKIAKENEALALNVVGQLKAKEALEAGTKAKEAAKKRADEWAEANLGHAKAMGEQAITSNAYQAASLAMFGKKFQDLTSEENKQKVLWKVEEDRAAAAKKRFDDGQDYAKTTLAELQKEIDSRAILTRADQVRYDVAARRKAGETVTDGQSSSMLSAAKVLDDADWKTRLAAFTDELQSNVDAVVGKARAGRQAAADAALGRYDDAMAELRARLVDTGTESEKAKEKTVRLAESFGTGATAADRIASGMTRAKAVMAAALRVDQAQAFQSRMRDMAGAVSGYFAKTATDVLTNFKLSFRGIAQGFAGMLADMARQQIAGQIERGGASWLAGILGGAFGGGGGHDWVGPFDAGISVGHRAVGGPVLRGSPYVVGERGPEMFVPSGDGSMMTARQTAGAGGGRPVNVTIHVAAPNPGAFHESAPQIAQQMGRRIKAAVGSLG